MNEFKYIPEPDTLHQSRYRVQWNGQTIGRVYKTRVGNHRKAKNRRIIIQHRYATRWKIDELGRHRVSYDTRRAAASQLLKEYYNENAGNPS